MNIVSEAATYISTFLGASKKCTLKGLDSQCLFVVSDDIFTHTSTQFLFFFLWKTYNSQEILLFKLCLFSIDFTTYVSHRSCPRQRS